MNDTNRKQRKCMRLKTYNYNLPGTYFITICTKDRKPILSTIDVGTGVLDGPKIRMKPCGNIANEILLQMNDFYGYIVVEKFVIMPNHIHLLLRVLPTAEGPSGTPVPTTSKQNSIVSQFISTFKRFCNKKIGKNIWQYRSHDHIVRGDQDYREIWRYIEDNPAKWLHDRFYTQYI